ncbi:MAG: hypothetical protein ACI835_004128 [Planctomycetota bacterium]|jgi:hypothetical protein
MPLKVGSTAFHYDTATSIEREHLRPARVSERSGEIPVSPFSARIRIQLLGACALAPGSLVSLS